MKTDIRQRREKGVARKSLQRRGSVLRQLRQNREEGVSKWQKQNNLFLEYERHKPIGTKDESTISEMLTIQIFGK